MNQQQLAAELLRLSAQLLSQQTQEQQAGSEKLQSEPEKKQPRRVARILEMIAKVPRGTVRVAPHRLEYSYSSITMRIPIPASMQDMDDEEIKNRLLVAYSLDIIERPDGTRILLPAARPAPQDLRGRFILTEDLVPHVAAIVSHLITWWCKGGLADRLRNMVPSQEDLERWQNADNREVRTPDVESLRQGFVLPEERLAHLIPRRSPRQEHGRFQVSVYLPYKVLDALRPRIGEALDDLMRRAPSWAALRYQYIPWEQRFPYAGKPVKSTAKLDWPYPLACIYSVVATTLEMLEKHGEGFRWNNEDKLKDR